VLLGTGDHRLVTMRMSVRFLDKDILLIKTASGIFSGGKTITCRLFDSGDLFCKFSTFPNVDLGFARCGSAGKVWE
jgi:hypothetical protein